MPKIVRIVNRFNLGGPMYNVAYLSRYLSPDFETCLAGGITDSTEADSLHTLRQLGLDPLILASMKRAINPINDYEAFRRLKKIITEFKPDIVHTHASKAGTIGRLAAVACKVPVIVHTFHGHVFHSYFGRLKSGVFKTIERELARKSSAIIAISPKQKEEISVLHQIAPADKIKVIPLGFDLSRFRENMDMKRSLFRNNYAVEENEIAIGIVGRLVPVKNHTLFLDSIRYVSEKSNVKIKAFVIGDGEEKQKLMELSRKLQIDRKVIFTSWIVDADIAFAGLDIVCLTSFNEGTPVSLIEAQAAGKPIVSTNAGGIENTVMENKTALLSPVNDPSTYFDNLMKMVESAELRNNLSLGGWDFVSERYHYTRLVNDTKRLYYELLK